MISVSAPGSLMLFGEHAVLGGSPCITAAHQGRLVAELTEAGKARGKGEGSATGFWATSDLWPGPVDLTSPHIPAAATFVAKAFQHVQPLWTPTPFILNLSSTFSPHIGFGSSAAVVVATLGALWTHHTHQTNLSEEGRRYIWSQARDIIRGVQGVGSGADAAASVWGGVVWYDPHPADFLSNNHPSPFIRKLTLPPTTPLGLVAVYCGFKEKTPAVVAHVTRILAPFPKVRQALFETSRRLTEYACQALENGEMTSLGQLAKMAQGLLQTYDVNLPVLQDIMWRLEEWPQVQGAKISGSGRGDCVIGLGDSTLNAVPELKAHMAPYDVFPVEIEMEGMTLAQT